MDTPACPTGEAPSCPTPSGEAPSGPSLGNHCIAPHPESKHTALDIAATPPLAPEHRIRWRGCDTTTSHHPQFVFLRICLRHLHMRALEASTMQVDRFQIGSIHPRLGGGIPASGVGSPLRGWDPRFGGGIPVCSVYLQSDPIRTSRELSWDLAMCADMFAPSLTASLPHFSPNLPPPTDSGLT